MSRIGPSQTRRQTDCHPKTKMPCNGGIRYPLQVFVGPIESSAKRAKGGANHRATVIFTAVGFKAEQWGDLK